VPRRAEDANLIAGVRVPEDDADPAARGDVFAVGGIGRTLERSKPIPLQRQSSDGSLGAGCLRGSEAEGGQACSRDQDG